MKTIIAIGGGEIRQKDTLDIDRFIADLAKKRAGERRAYGLFLGTASHDSMPYFNSFRKTYTSVFDVKADVALTVYGEMNFEHIKEKFDKADFIYVGGGDTKYMLQKWSDSGVTNLVKDAYQRDVIVAGLSAGAICWFDDVYSDYDIIAGKSGEYKFLKGLGWLKGLACPHYDDRPEFDDKFMQSDFDEAYALQNNSALVFCDETLVGAISAGGKAYKLTKKDGKLVKTEIENYGL